MQYAIMSDPHLGYRQYGLDARYFDFNKAFWSGLHAIKDRGVKYLLVAGDLLHHSRPTSRTVRTLREIHDWAVEHGICIIVCGGNHDLTSPHWLSSITGVEGTPDTPSPGMYCYDDVVVRIPDGPSVHVYGYRNADEFKSNEFHGADILLCHQSVMEFIGYMGGNTLCFEDLPYTKYQMIVVGDTHVTSLKNYKNCTIMSPGSTEMNAENEPTDKFVFIISAERGASGKVEMTLSEQVPLNVRKVIRYDLHNRDGVEEIIDGVRNLLPDPTTRATVSIRYARSCKEFVDHIRDALAAHDDIIFRSEPLPGIDIDTTVTIKEVAQVAGRSIVEIASQEVRDQTVSELLTRIIDDPNETSTITEEWLHKYYPTASSASVS